MPFIRLETESAECSCLCLLQPFLKWQATNPKTQLSTRQRHKRHSINLLGEMSKWFHRLQGWHCKCTSLSINGRKKQSSPVYVHKTTEQKLSNPSSNNCRLATVFFILVLIGQSTCWNRHLVLLKIQKIPILIYSWKLEVDDHGNRTPFFQDNSS